MPSVLLASLIVDHLLHFCYMLAFFSSVQIEGIFTWKVVNPLNYEILPGAKYPWDEKEY